MKILDLEQGTSAWLEYRKQKITGTDVSKILNANPWQNAFQLWEEKLGLKSNNFMSAAMQRGKDYEDDARIAAIDHIGLYFEPAVIESSEAPWLMASLDGISEDNKVFLEIKVPMSWNFDNSCQSIPLYYRYQLQTIFAASDGRFERGYFVIYNPDTDPEGLHVTQVFPDYKMIDEIIEKSFEFKKRLREFDPPPPTHRVVGGQVVQKARDDLKAARDMIKVGQQLEEEAEKVIKGISAGESIQGEGIRLTHYWRKGVVDYDKIPELKGVDREKFRKPSSESVRITLID